MVTADATAKGGGVSSLSGGTNLRFQAPLIPREEKEDAQHKPEVQATVHVLVVKMTLLKQTSRVNAHAKVVNIFGLLHSSAEVLEKRFLLLPFDVKSTNQGLTKAVDLPYDKQEL